MPAGTELSPLVDVGLLVLTTNKSRDSDMKVNGNAVFRGTIKYIDIKSVQTQIRLLQKEQSDQGLHCLPFNLHPEASVFSRCTIALKRKPFNFKDSDSNHTRYFIFLNLFGNSCPAKNSAQRKCSSSSYTFVQAH